MLLEVYGVDMKKKEKKEKYTLPLKVKIGNILNWWKPKKEKK